MPIILVPIDTVPYSTLLKEVMLHLPIALEFDVEYRMKLAVRDFCRQSRLYRQENTDLLTTVAGQQSYDAGLPTGTELVAVASAWDGDEELDVELPGERDDYQPGISDSSWVVGVEPTMDAIRLSPAPDTSGLVLKGTIVLAPNEESTDLPAFIYRRWRSTIAAGCIAKVKAQTGKPWSDPLGSDVAQRKFDEGCALASNMAGPVRRRPLRVIPV